MSIAGKKLRAAQPPVHRSVSTGYEGEFVSPLPNSIRGARDDRCWWEAFQGVGEGVNTVTRVSKKGKALINSCVCCYSCVSCTAQLSVRDTKAPNEGSSRSDLPLLRASVFFFSKDEL